MNAMIAKWFPASEKSIAVAIATTGNQLGPLLAYPIGSFLCPMTNVLGGWPLTFYVAGK
jgi:MFS family permease